MSKKLADPVPFRPEQVDPLSYELDALRKFTAMVIKENDRLDALNPAHQERIYLNLLRLEQTRDQIKDLIVRLETRSRPPVPAKGRHLRLVSLNGSPV